MAICLIFCLSDNFRTEDTNFPRLSAKPNETPTAGKSYSRTNKDLKHAINFLSLHSRFPRLSGTYAAERLLHA